MNIPRQETERVVVSRRHQELRDNFKSVRSYITMAVVMLATTMVLVAGGFAMTWWNKDAHVVRPRDIDVQADYLKERAKLVRNEGARAKALKAIQEMEAETKRLELEAKTKEKTDGEKDQ